MNKFLKFPVGIVALGAISILPTLGQKGAKPKLSEK